MTSLPRGRGIARGPHEGAVLAAEETMIREIRQTASALTPLKERYKNFARPWWRRSPGCNTGSALATSVATVHLPGFPRPHPPWVGLSRPRRCRLRALPISFFSLNSWLRTGYKNSDPRRHVEAQAQTRKSRRSGLRSRQPCTTAWKRSGLRAALPTQRRDHHDRRAESRVATAKVWPTA
jgi:hypothetical protein